MQNSRYEIKFLISTKAIPELLNSLKGVMKDRSPNAKTNRYINRSIYFDTHKLRFYREKQEGLKRRSKPRLRIYLDSQTSTPQRFFLEIKSKNDRVSTKSRIELQRQDAEKLLDEKLHQIKTPEVINNDTFSYFQYLQCKYLLKPKLTIQYHRQALSSDLYPNLRLTIDTSLKTSINTKFDIMDSDFFYILSPNYSLIELKYQNKFPTFISAIAKKHELKQATFSKYSSGIEALYEKIRIGQRYRHDQFTSGIKL